MTVYGHRQLHILFRPFIEILDNGFIYAGKKYKWNDIKIINSDYDYGRANWIFGLPCGIPKTLIQLNDGKSFKINSRIIEKKGSKPVVDFFSNKSDAYEELVNLLIEKSSAQSI